VPLVKCKTGDLTDVNNYRAIALSNAVTKIWNIYCLTILEIKMKLTIFSLVLRKDIPLPIAFMCLKELLSIIDVMVVTYLPVL